MEYAQRISHPAAAPDDGALAASRLQLAFDQAPVGLLQLDLDGAILRANQRLCSLLDVRADTLAGRHFSLLVPGDDNAVVGSAIRHRRAVTVLLRRSRPDGALSWTELAIAPVPDEHGTICHYIGTLSDVSELKEKEEMLAFHATHDALTGLPNRALFNDRLQQTMLQTSHRGASLALLCLGIDHYHLVNESLGHDAGEQMLAECAQRLRLCIDSRDTMAYLSGNEFLIILGDLEHGADALPICERLFAAMAPAFVLDGHQLHASASIGVALYPQDAGDRGTLLRYADLARARAREQGGGQCQFFSTEMNLRTQRRIEQETALRQALARDELCLHYQPLADLQTGALAGVEALLRWQHPQQGLLGAGAFLPLVEDAGLNGALGAWALRQACRDLRDWHAAGHPLQADVNVAPQQFHDRLFAATVAAALAEFGLPPSALTLDITEATLMQDVAASAARLDQLKALGVRLALDDFGTGHSSLSNLKRYAFDRVKIDCVVIRDLVTDGGDAALAKTIIAMAHHLGIVVVAEGVETEQQCDFLRRHMCDLIQGYVYAPPLPADAIADLLATPRLLPPHLLRIQRAPRSLLLVDDEPNVLASLKRLLRPDGYQIHSAATGEEGLALLARHAIDVIVSDQRMPGMIGADFLRKARELYPDTMRIMLSGYTELQSVTDAVNEGAIYKFLTKPWDDALLRGHIADAFRLKEIADDNARLHLEVRTANHELAATNRRMEELLQHKQQQISRGETSLQIARELLQHLPLAVIGMDEQGMIAFVNGAAERLFARSGSLLGEQARAALPALFQPGATDGMLLDGDAAAAGDGADGGAATGSGTAAGFASGGATQLRHHIDIDGVRYAVQVDVMGTQSASRGCLITLSRAEVAT